MTKVSKPYSAKEARIKKDYSLINVFEERKFSISAFGDSNKRVWGGERPITFGDLLTRWWPSKPHQRLEEQWLHGLINDMDR